MDEFLSCLLVLGIEPSFRCVQQSLLGEWEPKHGVSLEQAHSGYSPDLNMHIKESWSVGSGAEVQFSCFLLRLRSIQGLPQGLFPRDF